MIIMGIDPSTDGASYAVLDMRNGARKFRSCGEVQDLNTLLNVDPDVDHVAIERPSGVHLHLAPSAPYDEAQKVIMRARSMGLALMRASYVAGYVRAMFHGFSVRVVEVSPDQWRTALGVSRRTEGTDARVKSAIESLITNWPKRSNTHVRDAAGVALAAAWTKGTR